jgi:L-ascorbate metabolism protein UlaG (beta-lactamase superfamily)
MNAVDAARLTAQILPLVAVPVHWDLFAKYGTDPVEYLGLIEETGIKTVCMKAYNTYDMNEILER